MTAHHRILAVAAALCGALAVVIGAFAAHGAGPQVKSLLTTGGHYLSVHALLALAIALWAGRDRLAEIAGWLALAGGLVFCLSLGGIVWFSSPSLGAITPIGGVLMILAWLLLAVAAFRGRPVAD